MPTRRQFVIGAAGAVGAGAVAVAGVGPRRILDSLLEDCGAEPSALPRSAYRIERGLLRSSSVSGRVGYAVARPPGAPKGPLPVVYCLPGRGSSGASVLDEIRPQDAMVLQEASRPVVLAAVDGGASYWHARKGGEDRMAMLFEDFIPMCERRFGASSRERSLYGISMGGYGALRAMELRPQAFRAVAAASPAIWRTHAEQQAAVPDAFDGPADFRRGDVIRQAGRLRAEDVRIDCGREDPFFPAAEAMVRAVGPGCVTGFAAGCHGGSFWRRQLPADMAFLAARFR